MRACVRRLRACPSCAASSHGTTAINNWVRALDANSSDGRDRIEAACAELQGTLPGGDLQALVPSGLLGRVMGGSANAWNGKPKVRLASHADSASWLLACAPDSDTQLDEQDPGKTRGRVSPVRSGSPTSISPLELVVATLRKLGPDCTFKMLHVDAPAWPWRECVGASGEVQRVCNLPCAASAATDVRCASSFEQGGSTRESDGSDWLVVPRSHVQADASAEEVPARAADCSVTVRLKERDPDAADEQRLAVLEAAW